MNKPSVLLVIFFVTQGFGYNPNNWDIIELDGWGIIQDIQKNPYNGENYILDSCLYRVDNDYKKECVMHSEIFDSMGVETIECFAYDDLGQLLIGTKKGICKIGRNGVFLGKYPILYSGYSTFYFLSHTRKIEVLDEFFIIASDEGVYRIKKDEPPYRIYLKYAKGKIMDISIVNDCIYAHHADGIITSGYKEFSPRKYPKKLNNIKAMTVGNSGLVYVANYGDYRTTGKFDIVTIDYEYFVIESVYVDYRVKGYVNDIEVDKNNILWFMTDSSFGFINLNRSSDIVYLNKKDYTGLRDGVSEKLSISPEGNVRIFGNKRIMEYCGDDINHINLKHSFQKRDFCLKGKNLKVYEGGYFEIKFFSVSGRLVYQQEKYISSGIYDISKYIMSGAGGYIVSVQSNGSMNQEVIVIE